MELEPLHTSRDSASDNTEHARTQKHPFEDTSIREVTSYNDDESQSSARLRPSKHGWAGLWSIFAASRHKTRSFSQKHITAGALLLMSVLISSVLIYLAVSNGVDTRWLGYETSDVDCDLIKANGGSVVFSEGLTTIQTPKRSLEQLSFAIDIRTPPKLTLAQAKAIDVIWNLFIGQGLRFIFGYVVYRVSCDLLVMYMIRAKVPYKFYVALCLDGPSISTVWQSIETVWKAPIVRSRLAISGVIIGMIYAVAFPTLASTTSGYLVPTVIRWQMPDNSLVVNVGNATDGCFQVHDGSRIGLYNDSVIYGPYYDLAVHKVMGLRDSSLSTYNSTDYPNFENIAAYYPVIPAHYSMNIDAFMELSSNITINGTYYALAAPPLNLTFDNSLLYNQTYGLNGMQRCFNGKLIPGDWEPEVVCVPNGNGYVWGLAKYFAIGVLSLHIIWSFVIYAVWLYVNIQLDATGHRKRLEGKIQCSSRLSKGIEKTIGEDFQEYSDKKLKQALINREGISF